MSSEDRDFLDGIYQDLKPTLVDEEPRPFQPWHKPRKHYLRVHQWCSLIQDLIKELRYKQGGHIGYLGLPGNDFLDVRTIHGVCERAGVTLRYLGFDSTAQIEVGEYQVNLAKHEVSSLGFIDPRSRLVRDRIESVAKEQSTAKVLTESLGPYDVINLDLCESVARSSGFGSYFDTIKVLCDLQIQGGRVDPWLLLLTTRITRAEVDVHIRDKLLSCVRRNIEDNPPFGQHLKTALGLDNDALDAELEERARLDHGAFVMALCVGFGKWLVNLTMSTGPSIRVKLLQSYSYRIHNSEPDMLSLAFRFEPVIQPRFDRTGLAPTRSACVSSVTEAELAMDIITGVQQIEDIDQKLRDDSALNEKMIQKCAQVLATARYNKERYMQWARDSIPQLST